MALWHMSMASHIEMNNIEDNSISNISNFVEPDISVVYQNEIYQMVNEFTTEHQDYTALRELGFDKTQQVVDQLWAHICGQKLAITQKLVAAILRRQSVLYRNDKDVKQQLENLSDRLYNRDIPPARWRPIVQLTSRSLCSSDLCPWLHRIVEQVENYLVENFEQSNYTMRIAHLAKGYCHEHSYSVIDEIVSNRHRGNLDIFEISKKIFVITSYNILFHKMVFDLYM